MQIHVFNRNLVFVTFSWFSCAWEGEKEKKKKKKKKKIGKKGKKGEDKEGVLNVFFVLLHTCS